MINKKELEAFKKLSMDFDKLMKKEGYKKTKDGGWTAKMTPKASAWMDYSIEKYTQLINKKTNPVVAWKKATDYANRKIKTQFKAEREK